LKRAHGVALARLRWYAAAVTHCTPVCARARARTPHQSSKTRIQNPHYNRARAHTLRARHLHTRCTSLALHALLPDEARTLRALRTRENM